MSSARSRARTIADEIAAFRTELHALHNRAGKPSRHTMAKRAGRPPALLAFLDGTALPTKDELSTFLVALKVPNTAIEKYVLYHPGFTRSGPDGHPNPVLRGTLRLLARFFARQVADSVRPVVEWIDHPPAARLTAVDRGRPLDLSLKTLDEADAARLAAYTADLVAKVS